MRSKGRKQRVIPLWKNTASELRTWLNRINPTPDTPVFPNRSGAPLTRSGVRDRLDRAVAAAEQRCPSLRGQRVSPHTLRHSTVICTAIAARGTAKSGIRRLVPHGYPLLSEARATGPRPGTSSSLLSVGLTCLTFLNPENRLSPGTLRNRVQITTAMHLLQSGTDLAVIALWLGHSSPAVTHQYLEADLAAKDAALQRLTDPGPTPARFHPGDQLLAFLDNL